MAPQYRKIDLRIWSDEKFQFLTPSQKLLALYLLTSPQSNRLGIFTFSVALAAEDLGVTPEGVRHDLDTLCHTLSWRCATPFRLVWIPKYLTRYNPPSNESHWLGMLEDLHTIPDCELLSEFITVANEYAEKRLFSRVSREVSTPCPTPCATPSPTPCPTPSGTRCATPLSLSSALALALEEDISHGSPETDETTQAPVRNSYPKDFEEFWKAYPHRGQPSGKKATFAIWKRIPFGDRHEVVQAATNYATTKRVTDGFAKDAERFLKADYWRDFLELTEAEVAQLDPEAKKREQAKQQRADELKRVREARERKEAIAKEAQERRTG